jgi:hypothetical protein
MLCAVVELILHVVK